MSEIHLTIADEKMARLRQRAIENGCVSPEAYVENLIEEDIGQEHDKELETLLLQRLDRPTVRWTRERAPGSTGAVS